MSFTSATLLPRESTIVAHLYAQLGDWAAVRDQIVAGNLLQMRTLNASRRICREAISRLRLLTDTQRQLLLDGTHQEQRHVLWLAVCKRYAFIRDFASEVVHDQFLVHDLLLPQDAYDRFFQRKAEWHPEVERVAEATRQKQRQVVFKMLREAELLSDDGQLLPALLTPRLIDAIRADAPAYFAIFPVAATDLAEWTR
jgi:hypothetical protein